MNKKTTTPLSKEQHLDQLYRRAFEASWFRIDDDDDGDEGGDTTDEAAQLERRANNAQQLRTIGALNFDRSIANNHSSSATCYLAKNDLADYHKATHLPAPNSASVSADPTTSHIYLADVLAALQTMQPGSTLATWRHHHAQVPVDKTQRRQCDGELDCKGERLDCRAEELSPGDLAKLTRGEKPTEAKDAKGPAEMEVMTVKTIRANEAVRKPPKTTAALEQLSQVYVAGPKTAESPLTQSIGVSKPLKQYPMFVRKEPKKPAAEPVPAVPARQFEWVTLDSCSQKKAPPKKLSAAVAVAPKSKWQQYVVEAEEQKIMHEEEELRLPHQQLDRIVPPSAAKRPRQEADEPAPAAGCQFISAREQLLLADRARNERQPAAGQEGSASSAPRKLLGSRRGGVQKAFVSPVPNAEKQVMAASASTSAVASASGSDEEPLLDERLRHIEPKMIELIRSEIMHPTMDPQQRRPIGWDDIAGLQYAKTTIREAVVWPMLRPDIFTGLRRPPRGILLFGPPGTGKTLIGKCIAAQSKSTFFSISASSLASKWIGDGEKLVRALFAVAAVHQPAVIFIDEIDSLLCQRSDTEHESSRRLKTEFLVQLDGAHTAESERILVVGATNRPHELDEAARRRLVKRLYVPLPDCEARCQLIGRLLAEERNDLTGGQIEAVAERTEGFSGADIKVLCQEASMGPIRALSHDECVESIDVAAVRAVGFGDFEAALERVRSSVSPADLAQYVKWDETYGSGTASATKVTM